MSSQFYHERSSSLGSVHSTQDEPDRKILVTGATGWVGKSFLHELQSIIPSEKFNSTVFAFASRATSLVSTNYKQEEEINIPIYPLSSIIDHSCKRHILLFHSAFLTKDRISRYGSEAFIEINQRITEIVSSCVQASASSRVVCISSGAASNAEKEQYSSIAMARDLYGYLKLSEEIQLSNMTETQVFRIYALTGRFMRNPQDFAIGDFLLQALKGQPLVLNSAFPVIRSYVSASDIAKCAMRWLVSSDKSQLPIGASSYVITLATLAELITKYYCLSSPISKPLMHPPNSYSCSPIFFDRFLAHYGIKPLPFIDQVVETANWLSSLTI